MDIFCSRDNAFVFISVIMVATERQLVVNVELGNFIIFSVQMRHFACWKFYLLAIDEGV